MIDLDSQDTSLLLNPRLSNSEAARLNRLLDDARVPDGLVWLMTSGSSGQAKLTGLSRAALIASAEAVNKHLETRARDRWLLALPVFHVGGLGILVRCRLSGARFEEPFRARRWAPEIFCQTALELRCTLSALVPTQVYDLVKQQLPCPPSLRAIVVGGGRLDESLYLEARELGYPLLPSYGLTECASQVATATLDSLRFSEFPALIALSHVDMRTSQHGQLELKSPALLSGYLFEDGETTEFFDPKIRGWFATEDRAKVDGRHVEIQGRANRIVKVGGESVELERLEAVGEQLRREMGLSADIAVIALPDERLGHLVALVVERRMSREEVSKFLDAYEKMVLPFERIRIVCSLDGIPRTPLGKLNLGELNRRLDDRQVLDLEERT